MKKKTKPAKGKKVVKKAKDWHRKIADSRGDEWRKNLVEGRRDSQLNPSIIKLARLKLGIDQSSIAKQLDVSVSTFGAIERGHQKVKTDTARVISKILRQSVDKLFRPAAASKNSNRKKYVAVKQQPSL